MTTAFLLHPASPLHDTGWSHPEHQGRLRALASAVGADLPALHGRVEQVEPREATEDELRLIHTAAHIERVRQAVGTAREKGAVVALDPDTRVSGASWDAAVGAAGAVLTSVEAVAQGRHRNAFVATRPPGHHATPGRAMGFCLFNNVALGARWLQDKGLARRLLIVDWDVHHGNGTQEVFLRDPDVFFLSLHQSPHWPGTGAAEETGEGAGRGFTLNVPLPAGTPVAAYRRRFEEALGTALERLAPDFVLVSSGFDVMAGDPLGGQLLEPGDLHALARRVREVAEEHCGGRLVVCLEGGYVPERLGAGTVAVLRALAGVESPDRAPDHDPRTPA